MILCLMECCNKMSDSNMGVKIMGISLIPKHLKTYEVCLLAFKLNGYQVKIDTDLDE